MSIDMVNGGAPRVFVVQQPTGRDPSSGEIVPTKDLSPAREWGSLLYILRDAENPFRDLDGTAEKVAAFFEREGFDEDDFLLLVGNPVLIGLVSAVAANFASRLRFLQWNRSTSRYREASARVWEDDDGEEH